MRPSGSSLVLIPAALGLAGLIVACQHQNETPAAPAGQFSGIPRVCVDQAAFPAGFDYPQAEGAVQIWVGNRDEARARVHGWSVWAGLNSPAAGGQPVWRTWCTSTQAFADTGGLPPAGGANANQSAAAAAPAAAATGEAQPFHRRRSLNAIRRADSAPAGSEIPIFAPNPPAYPVPAQVIAAYPQCYAASSQSLVDGQVFQSNGDIMIAGVIYNQPAYDWIRSQNLYQGSALDAFRTQGRIAEMPPGSIILKPMMWPIQGSGYTALPVWDNQPPSAEEGSYAGFEIQRLWSRAVAVTPQPEAAIASVDVTYLHGVFQSNGTTPLGPNTYRGAPVVGLDRFYTFRFPDLASMDPCDRAILDASAYWAYGRAFAATDYLALVAMHVMTKEQPAWTFQSVWWHDRPNDGVFAANRPDLNVPGPWRNYLMTSTYGIPALTAPAPGRAPAQGPTPPFAPSWPIAYNPYIELAADHPIRTNCMNCHHRAAWPRPIPDGPANQIAGSYEAPSPPGPDALDIFDWSNPIFHNLILTDAVWSIPDRAHLLMAPPPPPAGGAAPHARR
jgi:hypothetical protein